MCDLGQVDLYPSEAQFSSINSACYNKVACEGHRRHLAQKQLGHMLSTQQGSPAGVQKQLFPGRSISCEATAPAIFRSILAVLALPTVEQLRQ